VLAAPAHRVTLAGWLPPMDTTRPRAYHPAMAEGAERRRYPRIEVNAYVDYAGADVLLYHRVDNISLGGIGITSPSVEPVGAVVELVINFPDLDESIVTQGEVSWSRGDPKAGPVEMGIRYVNMPDSDRETLQRFLDRLRK